MLRLLLPSYRTTRSLVQAMLEALPQSVLQSALLLHLVLSSRDELETLSESASGGGESGGGERTAVARERRWRKRGGGERLAAA